MPIYEYRCGACGRVSEVFFRTMSAVTTPSCPACGSAKMERKISRVGQSRGNQGLGEFDAGGFEGPDAGNDPWADSMPTGF